MNTVETTTYIIYIPHISSMFHIFRYLGMTSESKNERFRRLAQSRGNRLIREIALLGNLANKKNYSYTADEVKRLFTPINDQLKETRALFDSDISSKNKVNF